jgi:hypothetical protein
MLTAVQAEAQTSAVHASSPQASRLHHALLQAKAQADALARSPHIAPAVLNWARQRASMFESQLRQLQAP